MSRNCGLTGKRPQTGHKVSHSNIKTLRRFLPNLQNVSFFSETLGRRVSLRVAANTIRSVDKNGGLDAFLLKTSNLKLSQEAKRLKKQIIKINTNNNK